MRLNEGNAFPVVIVLMAVWLLFLMGATGTAIFVIARWLGVW